MHLYVGLVLAGVFSAGACQQESASPGPAPVTPVPSSSATAAANPLHGHLLAPIPPQYARARNPYGYDNEDRAAPGELLYRQHCESCHGVAGRGDGPDAHKHWPRPSNLHFTNAHRQDPYVFWRIRDGVVEVPGARAAKERRRSGRASSLSPTLATVAWTQMAWIFDGALTCYPTAMPGFAGRLTDDEIWRVITFIRLRFLEF